MRLVAMLMAFLAPLTSFGSSNYIYELNKGKKVVYVFGGVHSYPSAAAKLSSCVIDAMDKSDDIYQESDPNITRVMAASFVSDLKAKMVIDELGESASVKLKAILGAGYEGVFSWNAAALYGLLAKANGGLMTYMSSFREEYGFNYQIYVYTKKRRILLGDIEAPEVGFKAYNAVPLRAWVTATEYLLESTTDTTRAQEYLTRTITAGKAALIGDEHALLNNTTFAIHALSEINDAMFFRRNEGIAEAIFSLSENNNGKPIFVALGAIHLPGESGVIARLKAMGYASKRICLKN